MEICNIKSTYKQNIINCINTTYYILKILPMKITFDLNTRTLVKDDNTTHTINDGSIVKYTGMYYQTNSGNIIPIQTETLFIGKIHCHRYRYNEGITGVYIHPLYIYYNDKWYKIINYKDPYTKYFYYPHLLMLPNTYYNFQPLYYLHTLENISLYEFEKNTPNIGEMELDYIV